eukprot:scaffold1008_cov174-Amphora_coffeaeformis.AAC.9
METWRRCTLVKRRHPAPHVQSQTIAYNTFRSTPQNTLCVILGTTDALIPVLGLVQSRAPLFLSDVTR